MPVACLRRLSPCVAVLGLIALTFAPPTTAQPAVPAPPPETSSSVATSPDRAADRAADRDAVHQAALDYVMALYDADPSRVDRSVHPELTKYGYWHNGTEYRGRAMTFDQLKDLARTWNADEERLDPDTADKDVIVYDVLDKTASAKIVADWGIDYMHLAKVDGSWKIRNILWQSVQE